ncbi:MAG TPA: family 1 glycosylhydrolase, partial [Chthoniobacterales bacterium]
MNISSRIVALFALPVLLAGCIMPPKARHPQVAYKAPDKTFWWGTSTSPFQNEDVDAKPGSPTYFRTDWDLFADEGHTPPRGNAVYSWSHFDKDLAALRELGVNHFRFGIEWARVEPRPGQFNDAAIQQYARMAREVR